MEVEEIRDADSLMSWHEALPQEAERKEAQRWAVAIAHQTPMRALPQTFQSSPYGSARDTNSKGMPILRMNLISGVAAMDSTPEIRTAAARAEVATATAVILADLRAAQPDATPADAAVSAAGRPARLAA
ncbi:hypothetical protein HUK65_10340 [Rhodobacteraceae bacterium 2376]|uniref:Uncharacterized protein n=1 Tax=Rhabdonatronobacter sediminivivens TaxID=2743469 RepID=A0A7Z0HZY4_9RHOB|nr:hypothetical protein [Rhabdonatronobacter sediminivivens]NYS25391.1 hypothetical protein [Rhabdonatronobacter sediminivivens]